ncbi:MAG: hypothetical protein U1D55_01290 [Phycisphaerae bacterium]
MTPPANPRFESTPAEFRRTYLAIGGLILFAALLAAHGWSLADGTVLDDHWHQRNLRVDGWSLPELLRSTIIEPARFIHCWWQEREVRWEYLRPVFIFCMKVIYVVLGGNNPIGLHIFSIALHGASAALVWRLAFCITASRPWSLLAAFLFVIYPHASITVAWPSSQNAVLQTTLTLAALLCYVNASRLDFAAARERGGAAAIDGPTPALDRRWFVGALLLWLVALFTRENALMLPIIAAAIDVAYGGRRHARARVPLYLGAGVICVAFMVCRALLITHPMPDVYVRRPDGDWPEYLLWCLAKFLHYFAGSIWLSPMTVGPTGRYNPWTEAPGDCLLMVAICAFVGGAYVAAARRQPGWWIWPLWIALAVLPVVPVIATPHSGYLSGVGFAIGAAVAATRQAGADSAGAAKRLAAGGVIFFAVAMSVMTMLNRWQWTGIIAAERYVPAWVSVAPPERSVRHVFFLNLPFVNVYCKRPLVDQLGPWFEDVTAHALTFAPQPVMIEERTIVRRLGPSRLGVEIEGQPYFSRLMGRFLIEAYRGKRLFEPGEVIHGEEFDVRVERVDADGVRALTFDFRRPLNDPAYAFYLCSADCGAARLRFDEDEKPEAVSRPTGSKPSEQTIADAANDLRAGHSAAAKVLFAAVAGDDAVLATSAGAPLREVAACVAEMLGAPVQVELAKPELSRDDWALVEAWWTQYVTNRTLAETWLHRHDFDELIKLREEVPHARLWAGRVIKTDTYLSGPPFPGLRQRKP